MVYGLPYKGSKNTIAERIVELFPSGGKFVDCCCGGGAIIQAAALSGKFKKVIGYDIHKPIVGLLNAVLKPGTIDYEHYPLCSKEEFYQSRDNPQTIRDFLNIYTSSFGYNGREYLWGEHKLYYKQLLHECVMDDSAESRYKKILAFARFLNVNPHLLVDACRSDQLSRLRRFRMYEDSLKDCKTKIRVIQKSMFEIDYDDGDLFYFDPPYRTAARGYTSKKVKFDYDRFSDLLIDLKKRGKKVFVSELSCPAKGYKLVWQTEKLCTQGADSNTRVNIEQLWSSV